MSVDLTTNPGGLFRRLARIANIQNVVNEYRGSSGIAVDVDELEDQYDEDRNLIEGVESALAAHQSSTGGVLSTMRELAKNTLIQMVDDDNPLPEKTLRASLEELIAQMVANSQSVDASTVAASYSAYGSNTGNGVVTLSTKTELGKNAENLLAEDVVVTCATDAQTGGLTAGNEIFRARGEARESDKLSHDWPQGSGASTSLRAILATSDNSNGNLLTNSNFEDFTVANTPDNWTIATGVAGTTVKRGATAYTGTYSLEFDGDASTLMSVTQTLDSSSGTLGELLPQRVYSFNCWIKSDVVPAAGTLQIELIDGSNTIIADDAGTNNQITKTLATTTTSFAALSGHFRTPRVLPTTIKLRIRLSVALSNTTSVFIDHASLGLATELYSHGPHLAIHSGSTAFIRDDYFTVTTTNDREGAFQEAFERWFSMRDLGLLLPSNSAGSETIPDSYIDAGFSLLSGGFTSELREFRSALVNFKTGSTDYSIFTVPAGQTFLLSTMEILTVSASSVSAAPTIRFGNTSTNDAYQAAVATTSTTAAARHIIESATDGIAAGVTVSAGVATASTATTHTGYLIVTGYLIDS